MGNALESIVDVELETTIKQEGNRNIKGEENLPKSVEDFLVMSPRRYLHRLLYCHQEGSDV